MSLSLERLRYNLRKGLGGLDAQDLSDEDADELLNLSLWALEDKFPFEVKETAYYTSLVAGRYEYTLDSLPSLDALRSVAVVDSEGKRTKLSKETRDFFDTRFSGETGLPLTYTREGACLFVYPIPTTAHEEHTLEISVKDNIASLIASDDTTGLPRNWDEIVLYGAIARGHNLNQDYALRDLAHNFQRNLILDVVTTESKEEEDSRYARLDVLWDWPE